MDCEDESEAARSCTPPEVAEAANKINLHFLPPKSKKIYINTYKEFLNWCTLKDVTNYSENVFIAYFSEKSTVYKASTLWSHYSMLKMTFNINRNIDISKFTRLVTFLKRTAKNYKPKKSKVFTRHEIEKFIEEAPDNQFLMLKVVAIFGIAGACRRHELWDIQMDDIQDAGTALIITLRECKTKISRTFTVIDHKDKPPNLLQIYRKYACLRPPITNHTRFFIFYRNGKCTKQPVGINQFGKIPSLIATYLDLSHPELYTGHCFRRSSASLLADSGADCLTIRRHGGWKSSPVAEGRSDSSPASKKDATKAFGIENHQQPQILQTLADEDPFHSCFNSFDGKEPNVLREMQLKEERTEEEIPSDCGREYKLEEVYIADTVKQSDSDDERDPISEQRRIAIKEEIAEEPEDEIFEIVSMLQNHHLSFQSSKSGLVSFRDALHQITTKEHWEAFLRHAENTKPEESCIQAGTGQLPVNGNDEEKVDTVVPDDITRVAHVPSQKIVFYE